VGATGGVQATNPPAAMATMSPRLRVFTRVL
jgi:hypothetical protein